MRYLAVLLLPLLGGEPAVAASLQCKELSTGRFYITIEGSVSG